MTDFRAAITGMGLLCRRYDREISPGREIPASRFIYVDDPPIHPLHTPGNFANWHAARSLKLALSAAISAQNNRPPQERCGTVITVSKGLFEQLETQIDALHQGRMADAQSCIFDYAPDAAARLISRTLNLNGPQAAAVAACASGLASLKLSIDWLRDDLCDEVLAGSAESSDAPMILSSFARLGVISALGRTRPFDARRDGFVVGEGAAIFRLEPMERAHYNDAAGLGPRVLGRILSLALGSDAHHLTTPDSSGNALAQVLNLAITRAGLEPAEIGWIHAHGTATAYNDPVEVAALKKVFGRAVPPLTATKGATGHLLGASGAVALAITLESLRGKIIPQTTGLEKVAEEFVGVDLVIGRPRHTKAWNALVLNHGFGGHIAATVVAV